MLLIHLLGWWYSWGWSWIFGLIHERLGIIAGSFSVGTLLRTLFSPWKQIQTSTSFRNFLQSKIDNFISRFVGATVRIGMLIGAFVSTVVVLIFGAAFVIVWPFLPVLVFVLPILSITGTG